jgi:hypothetical protein
MKKLVVLVLVLAMAQLSFAGIATLRVNAADVKNDYLPSDTITIEIVASYDTGMGGTDTTGSMSMDSISATAGEAISTWINAGFNDIANPGLVVNTGGMAVQGIAGTITTSAPDIAAGEVLWSMEFHIPDLPGSTIIDISTVNFFSAPSDFTDMATETNVLSLHIVPEPITMALLGLGGLFLRRRK